MKKIFLILIIGLCSSIMAQSELKTTSTKHEETYKKFTSGEDVINWWSELYNGLILSKEEKDIIYQYTFGDFVVINDKLRNGFSISSLDEKQKNMVSRLDKALSKTIIFENIQVYRYETLGFLTKLIDKNLLHNIYKNGKFTDKAQHYLEALNHKKYKDYGFMSTTAIRNSVFQSRPIELIIKVPKYSSTTFVSLKDLAAFPTQYELLFPRDRVITIEKYEISNDKNKLTIYTKMTPPCYINQKCEEEKVDNLKQPKN
ncbi:ADP-ribosyltransferase [Campylobacter armoricus]|uniref:ADP-ribosyltransferase n=1 Tax=Campylobacter armoricus TaxID=2505970 RepID=UPI00111679CB|nr:ADP-ribosyltransferase [Campylobacter armoricus]